MLKIKAILSIAAALLLTSPQVQATSTGESQCVSIFYDRGPEDGSYPFGEVYATYLRNLLGHFPSFKQIIAPIETYQKGQIENCQANFYLGSYFENAIPEAFLEDFASTDKQVAWIGYSIWLYPQETLSELLGANYSHLTALDSKRLDAKGHPSFFREIHYKGERFRKFGEWVDRNGTKEFVGPFEMVALTPDPDAKVLAWAEQSVTQEKYPYILQRENRFYVADIPFSYIHESDRYLVFADLLFDILKAQPRHKEQLALLRMEDVHPLTSVRELNIVKKVFEEEDVPLHISLIPIFYDPLFRYDRHPDQEFVPLTEAANFLPWLKQAKDDGTFFIWHGVTHQYKKVPNPHSGYSSDDFEFWDANNNRAIKEDSVSYVLDRLQLGMEYLKRVGISPQVWLTPHYQASALSYRIFGKVFEWNIGRVIYFLDQPQGEPKWSQEKLKTLRFSSKAEEVFARQRDYFKHFSTEASGDWFGQLYPYEVYGDVYGQRIIPEILGNPQPFESDHVVWPRSVDEILEDARRNRVIRDSWASLFFHSYLLNDYSRGGIGHFSGDHRELRRLVRGLKDLGYQFIHLEDFIEDTADIENVRFQELK